ncbi:GatB/YqeY domain-containing protein [Alteribacter keqinensis]|uniref:GatB/YqeY domain-containing protein n=1 Tax=Alteribacter keqinensis TaxID=2483800 RepID=A0A3M7TV33_9BACI|nr:GatB/YqeY domain-containing protein [Alteribacter keqinensis]RNA68862.1 GatB/YqeY domain-containing protein [Alteribacter keqinensis]
MDLQKQLNEDMKQAMKNKEKQRLVVIRSVKSALQNEQIKQGKELTEDEALTVLGREMKQRKESLQEFEKANRDDLVAKIKAEMEVLETYLPEQLSDDELQKIVDETIVQVGASSKSDMGKVMGAIMPKVKGKADGNQVNRLVVKSLS